MIAPRSTRPAPHARFLLTTLIAILAILLAAPTAAAITPAEPRSDRVAPPLRLPAAELDRRTKCSPNIASSPRVPVLLLHGAGANADETWGRSYLPALDARGHALCVLTVPGLSMGDQFDNLEYVVTAIRKAHRLAGRKLSIIGVSNGAQQATTALRVWPDLAAMVDDVVGLAGVYDAGSAEISRRCRPDCPPTFHQVRDGSTYLEHVSRWPLPAGPSFSLLGTVTDLTVTPQPAANHIAGATTIQIEDVCAGRAEEYPTTHGMFLADAVAFALATDALDHPGASNPRRIDRAVCDEQYMPGFDHDEHLAGFARGRTFPTTTVAPKTRCHISRGCRNASARGRLLAKHRVRAGSRMVVYRGVAKARGFVQLRLGKRKSTVHVKPGRFTVRVYRTGRKQAKRQKVVVLTRTVAYPRWAKEHTKRVGKKKRR